MIKGINFFGDSHIINSECLRELNISTSSKGNQRKWYNPKTNEFIKASFEYQGRIWNDYLVEILSTKLANQMNLPIKVLHQEYCQVNDYGTLYNCVVSPDFSIGGSEFITFNRILKIIDEQYPMNAFIDEQFDFIIQTVKEHCKLDIEDYLLSMILLDIMLGNEDRHLNNFGVFSNGIGFENACLFDFGLGLFEHDRKYEKHNTFPEVLDWMVCKPFNANPFANLSWLQKYYSDFCKRCLPHEFQLNVSDFPNALGKEYFENVCMKLEVEVHYD